MFPRRAHPSLAIVMVFSVAFVLLGFLWLLTPAIASRAQSQPEALGSVSGVVRNAQGDPLPNITVWLEHPQNFYASRRVTSNAQGAYEFLSVYSGNYVLRFEDETQAYATTYRSNAAFARDAEIVTVNGNPVSVTDTQLQPSGTISVTLQDSEATTSTVYTMRLYRQTQSGQWTIYRYPSPLGVGGHLIGGLPSGSYRLCAEIYNPYISLPVQECYNNVLPEVLNELPPNSSDILVQAGAETAITIVLNDISQVEGTILGIDDQPLANITVALRQYNFIGGYPSNLAQTDEQGHFRFGFVQSGDYSLIFNFTPSYVYPAPETELVTATHYMKEYYPNVFASVNAAKISISASSHLSVTKKLTPEARLIGKATLPNNVPISNANVGIYRLRQDNSWSQPGECYEDCPFIELNSYTGVYTVTQLPAGTFRVRVDHYVPNGNSVLSAFYGGDTFESADNIVLAVGETKTNINVTLGATAFESGISGIVKANGEPQAGIEVGLFAPYWYPSPGPAIVQTTTDAQGQYRFEGLPIATYSVGFRDPAGVYATVFYADAPYFSEQVILTQTGILQGINIALSPGGTIRGRVFTPEGKQPGGFSIQVSQLLNDLYNPYPLRFYDVRTDANGFYEVRGIPPGNYFVLATVPVDSAQYPYGTLRYYPAAPDIYTAQSIPVTAGQVQGGRNVYFSARPTYFLPRIGSALPAPPTPTSAETPLPAPTPTWATGPDPTGTPMPTATPAFGVPVP